MRRAFWIVGLVAAGALGASADWGCATAPPPDAQGARLAKPVDPEPDGGWAAYRPAHNEYGPNPARAAALDPAASPEYSVGHDGH